MEEQPSKTPEENAGNKPEKQNPINDPEKSGNSRSGSKKAAVWFVFVVFLDVLVGIAAYVFGGWWMDAFWLVAGVSIYELLEKHLKILKTNLVLLVVAAVLNVFLFIDIILDSGNGVSAEWCWLAVAINAGISIYMLIRLLKAHLILKAWKPLDILAGLLAECMVLCFIICVVRYKVWYAWFFFALFSGTFFYNLLRLLRRLRILKTGKGTAVIFGLIIFVSIFLQAFNPYVIDSLDGKDVARRRIEWIEKADPEVKKAVVHMEKTDLKYPTVKDAVMAARCADIEALSVMKKNGFTNWDDPEIMLAACKTPFLVNVKMISRFGGDVNASDKDGVTALMFAARAGNVEIVKYLVSRGAYVNAKRKEEPFMGKTVLMYAAESGNIETVKYLVGQGADVKAKISGGVLDGWTVLMSAARFGNVETVKYLVSRGADIKAEEKDGTTALMYAAVSGNLETVKYLVSQGADIKEKDENGRTVLMAAAGAGNVETVKYLVGPFDRDVNASDKHGRTVLMYAVQVSGDLETVKYLVGQGADVNAKDKRGRTVLDLAKGECKDYLRSVGAR